ncbi:hypothetical protein E2562_038231 [Oryza meyeriana var. granulata]|uniref:Uncharacterized protein n=1 Tax=Oryza meyeriana var. granulata TaxID=110450 RepID=A0A6G1E9A3_9ORYZ|nr:hypothetical protein E2562_038231 [Oryza meyeriana var. granulata]
MSDESDDSIDLAEIYTLDMFKAEQSVLQSFAKRIDMKIKAKFEEGVDGGGCYQAFGGSTNAIRFTRFYGLNAI